MNWLNLVFQAVVSHQASMESHALMERARSTAKRSKRIAFFSAATMLAVFYLVTASLIAAIEFGLQYERAEFRWSGLYAAAVVLMGLAALIMAVATYMLNAEKAKVAAALPPPPKNEIKEALETLLATFIKQLAENLKEKRASDSTPPGTQP